MIHNITRNSAYNYSITYEKSQSKLKDWGGTKALVEKNDADNDVYRNAVTKTTMIAEDVRYSQEPLIYPCLSVEVTQTVILQEN